MAYDQDMNGSDGTPAIEAGGAALVLTGEKDRATVRMAMERWPKRWRAINDRRKQQWVQQLEEAGTVARGLMFSGDPDLALDAAKTVSSVVKTAVMMEGQNQKDDHFQEEYERAANGEAREVHHHKGVLFIDGGNGV